MNEDRWLGWHFLPADRRLQYGDGRKIVKGRTLRVSEDRPLVLCKYGLHASPTVHEAIEYAPGSILCRVELIGPRLDGNDKSVAYQRRVIAWADADSMLRLWACWCVRRVWPLLTDARSRQVVIVAERYARGKVTTKELAAAGVAAWDAARDAVWAAAGAAAWAAARAAAGVAAWDAARDAARDAAWNAAGATAWAAAWDAARDAAWAATGAAAWAAARDAAWDAARDAARAAARAALAPTVAALQDSAISLFGALIAGEWPEASK